MGFNNLKGYLDDRFVYHCICSGSHRPLFLYCLLVRRFLSDIKLIESRLVNLFWHNNFHQPFILKLIFPVTKITLFIFKLRPIVVLNVSSSDLHEVFIECHGVYPAPASFNWLFKYYCASKRVSFLINDNFREVVYFL